MAQWKMGPPRFVSFEVGSCSTSMMVGERVNSRIKWSPIQFQMLCQRLLAHHKHKVSSNFAEEKLVRFMYDSWRAISHKDALPIFLFGETWGKIAIVVQPQKIRFAWSFEKTRSPLISKILHLQPRKRKTKNNKMTASPHPPPWPKALLRAYY